MILKAITNLKPNHPQYRIINESIKNGQVIFENIQILISGQYKPILECTTAEKNGMPTEAAINAQLPTIIAESQTKYKRLKREQAFKVQSDNAWIDYLIEKEKGIKSQVDLDLMKATADLIREQVKTDNPL